MPIEKSKKSKKSKESKSPSEGAAGGGGRTLSDLVISRTASVSAGGSMPLSPSAEITRDTRLDFGFQYMGYLLEACATMDNHPPLCDDEMKALVDGISSFDDQGRIVTRLGAKEVPYNKDWLDISKYVPFVVDGEEVRGISVHRSQCMSVLIVNREESKFMIVVPEEGPFTNFGRDPVMVYGTLDVDPEVLSEESAGFVQKFTFPAHDGPGAPLVFGYPFPSGEQAFKAICMALCGSNDLPDKIEKDVYIAKKPSDPYPTKATLLKAIVEATKPAYAKKVGFAVRAFKFDVWDGVDVDEDGEKVKSGEEALKNQAMKAVICGKGGANGEYLRTMCELDAFAKENGIPVGNVYFAETGKDKCWGVGMTTVDLVSLFCFLLFI